VLLLHRLKIHQPYGLWFGCLCHEECSMKRKSIGFVIQSLWRCVMTRIRGSVGYSFLAMRLDLED
jgi:hypothetical protein